MCLIKNRQALTLFRSESPLLDWNMVRTNIWEKYNLYKYVSYSPWIFIVRLFLLRYIRTHHYATNPVTIFGPPTSGLLKLVGSLSYSILYKTFCRNPVWTKKRTVNILLWNKSCSSDRCPTLKNKFPRRCSVCPLSLNLKLKSSSPPIGTRKTTTTAAVNKTQ